MLSQRTEICHQDHLFLGQNIFSSVSVLLFFPAFCSSLAEDPPLPSSCSPTLWWHHLEATALQGPFSLHTWCCGSLLGVGNDTVVINAADFLTAASHQTVLPGSNSQGSPLLALCVPPHRIWAPSAPTGYSACSSSLRRVSWYEALGWVECRGLRPEGSCWWYSRLSLVFWRGLMEHCLLQWAFMWHKVPTRM